MNARAAPPFLRIALLPIGLAFGLAACGPRGEAPLAGARIGGPFALTDQNGRPASDRDFAGRYRIVYFGYTHCPDVCPTDLAVLSHAFALLDKEAPKAAARLAPIFITVDPDRDTPAELKLYLASFDRRLVGLTGSPKAIASVAKEYLASYAKGPVQPGGGYAMAHSRQMLLMGPAGAPIAILPVEQGAEPTARELERWVT
jgi:protein SCO1/2